VRALWGALLGFLLVLLTLLGSAPSALAHAQLESSDPPNSDIVDTMPSAITVTFTERLERSESRLELFDYQGNEIEGTTVAAGNDDYTMILQVPDGLPNGTYAVLWRTLSNDDGHTAQGYFTFTVGTAADIAAVVTVPTDGVTYGAPLWMQATARWFALLGLAAFMAIWPMWTIVLRPALAGVWREGPRFTRSARRYAVIAFALAVIGSVAALLVQVTTLSSGTYFDKVMNTIGQTRFGHLWLLRLGLLAFVGLLLCAVAWWYPRHRAFERAVTWIASFALVIPFSLNSHASAQASGRNATVLADMIHLLGAGLWVGGLAMLAIVLFPAIRTLDPQARKRALAIAIPRFSLIALVAWVAMGVTGLYSAWLQVGNLTALTDTPYGRSLLIKSILLALILVVAAINLLVIERQLTRTLADQAASLWSRRLTWTVALELVLVLGVFGAVGAMTSQEPGRDVLIERSKQIELTYDDMTPRAKLLLAPGVAGINHFRLEVGGDDLPSDTTALIRLTMPDNSTLGTKEITLARVAGNAFEYHGSDLGITGTWDFEVIIREPGAAQVQSTVEQVIGTTVENVDVPGTPWRFDTSGGVTGLLLVLIGGSALIFAIMQARGRLRKETSGLGVAAIALGCVLLLQARIDPILAVSAGDGAINPNDVSMVERGKETYTELCLSCHGADLRGDGPDAAGMDPQPADFSDPHTMVHSDSDLIYWIQNGKQGTAMPGFGDVLSDQQIRDVMAYIKSEQQKLDQVATVPEPTDCTTEPRTLDELEALVGTTTGDVAAIGGIPTSAPAAPASDTSVDTQTQSDIIVTAEQMVACTNAVDTMRRLALFSDAYLQASFPSGVTPAFAQMASQTSTPLPQTRWMALLDVTDITMLSDGRVSATVVIEDPSTHIHTAGGAEASADAYAQTATIIFVQVGDRWLIDAIQ